MKQATILVVDDNPITCKLVRFTLENQGFSVLVAADGASAIAALSARPVALVLQDLCLPDMDGFELVSKLRALPRGRELPILAFSGLLSPHDEAKVSSALFDDLISKPVEPSRLVQIVRSYLPSEIEGEGTPLGQGRRLIVADDDPVQRKLVGFRMQKLGFEVVPAADGNEALAAARRARPDAVVSDVLMPGLDGFGLCIEIRRDPSLARIPVVLTTNSYIDPDDRELARKAGAHDLVLRTPELGDVVKALRASLGSEPPPLQDAAKTHDVEREHVQRMMRQLERQVSLNVGISRRSALLAAEMAVLKGIAEALASHADIEEALRHTLAACFDAGGISVGALYLLQDGKLRVLGFGMSPDRIEGALTDFFGELSVLEAAMASHDRVIISRDTASPAGLRVLERSGAASVLVLPIAYREVSFGALVMFSRNGELQQDDRVKFGEAIAAQISQALAVAQAFKEKERLEQAATQQTAILQSVLESIGDGVGVVDGEGRCILWNSAANHIIKLGRRDPDSDADQGPFGVFDADTVTPVAFEELPLTRAMRGEAIDGVEIFVRHAGAPDGVWLSATGRPWCDEHGRPRGGVAVFRDVTREKATQAQLLVSDRMASVGMLAAGVAHEINNPLASVLANLELSHRELLEKEAQGAPESVAELREMLGDARSAADRVRQIIRDLKIFSRHEDTRSGAVNLQKVLESTLRMAWNEIRHRARLVKDYGEIPLVEGTESRLGQVFLNLIVNAAQAIPEGNTEANTIRIATRTLDADRVAVDVSDTGSGIDPLGLKNLFRPFYTTKGPGVGTGLGLAISHRIVTGLGGSIEVESKVGKGSTFRVILPAAQASQTGLAAPEPVLRQATRRARLLVVDDERVVLQAIRRTLSREHDVTVTQSPAEALERLRAGETFDIILCDLMMPQITGMDLYRQVVSLSPEHTARIIFLTGGAFTPAARAFLDEVPNQRVEKPFEAQHLRALVNDRIR